MATSSNTIGSPAGDIRVDFEADFTPTDSFQLLEIGDLQYNFDINDITKDTISEVQTFLGGVSIKTIDLLDDGVERMSEKILNSTRNLTVTIGSYVFPLRYTKGEFKIDDVGGTVSFDVAPTNDHALQGIPPTADVHNGNSDITTFSCFTAEKTIEAYLESFGETTFIFESSHYNDDVGSATGFPTGTPSDDLWAITNIPEDLVLRLARAEGAFFGTGFNNGFYVRRNSGANKVTITQDDILDISRTIQYPDLKSSAINFNNTGSSFTIGLFDVNDSNTIDAFARQEFSATCDVPEIIRVFYDGGDARLESRDDATSATAALAVTNTGLLNYQLALRGEAPFEITVKVNGFDTIKPWQPFDVTDTTGKLEAFTGRTYRPSSLTYSVLGEIEINAYAIT